MFKNCKADVRGNFHIFLNESLLPCLDHAQELFLYEKSNEILQIHYIKLESLKVQKLEFINMHINVQKIATQTPKTMRM